MWLFYDVLQPYSIYRIMDGSVAKLKAHIRAITSEKIVGVKMAPKKF